MSSKKSTLSSSVFSVSQCLNEDTEVYLLYNEKEFYLDVVPNYTLLCDEIEENLEGLTAKDLNITYQLASGSLITVQNEKGFINACKKMKPELKLICTSIVPKVPFLSTTQQINQEQQAVESSVFTPLATSQIVPSGLKPDGTNQQSQQAINYSGPHTAQHITGPQPTPTQVSTQLFNMQFHPFYLGMQPEKNIYENVNVQQLNPQSYPSIIIRGQDAARCKCGQVLAVSLPKSDTCPNQGCLLQANQTITQLWSCSNQHETCGKYCWVCVSNLLKDSQELVFENYSQLNQINKIRQEQFYYRPAYNPQWVSTPDLSETIHEKLKLNQEKIESDLKMKETDTQKVCKDQTDENLLKSQEKQTDSNEVKKNNTPAEVSNFQENNPAITQKLSNVQKVKSELPQQFSIPNEQNILGLNQNDFKKLEDEVVEYLKQYEKINDEFIDYLRTEFRLDEKNSELLDFCEKYNPIQASTQWPILPKVQAYLTKQKIIDFILKDEKTPQGFKLKKEFEGLTNDQLGQFKKCNKDFDAISFEEDHLFDEERKLVSKLLNEKKSIAEISKITLIHVDLVMNLFYVHENNLQKEALLLEKSSEHFLSKTNDENGVLKKIHVDGLGKEEFQIYQEKKEEEINPVETVGILIADKSSSSMNSVLGLDKNQLEDLKSEVFEHMKDSQKIGEDFLEFLCKEFNLYDKRSEVKDFCENLNSKGLEKPLLPKINAYTTKKRIIDFIVNNQKLPAKFNLKQNFESLNGDQLNQFKDCYQNFKAISFIEQDLFPEEIQLFYQLQKEKKSKKQISETTLIDVALIQKFYDQKLNNLKQETKLFELIQHHIKAKTNQEIIELINNDDEELVELLYKIYKRNKEDYRKITKNLRDQNYAINFEESQLQKLIKLAEQTDLCQRTDFQKEVLLLLDYFYVNDLEVYLMVLHDFSDIEQSQEKKNLENIILNEKHKDIRKAVVQLLILEKDQEKKNQVVQLKEFVDSLEDDNFRLLEEQIKLYLDLKIEQQKENSYGPQNYGQLGSLSFRNQKEQIEEQGEDDIIYRDDHQMHFNKLDMSENDELVNVIDAICNITNMKIEIHLKSELTCSKVYKPKTEEGQGTLHLVRDDKQKVFYVMIQFENEKKIISWDGLKVLKNKYPFLNNKIPSWLDTFIKLDSLRMFLNDLDDNPKKIFEDFDQKKKEFLQKRDEISKKNLYDAALKFNLDSQLMQEWFHQQKDDMMMADFCNFMINKGTRQKPNWAITSVDNLQQYFPINAKKQTLKDFNRVQTYQDPDNRKNNIEMLKSQPNQLTQFIINTLFGVILRKDEISSLQSELDEKIKGLTISLRFLVSYLLQSADFGLRARLNYYLCQNKSVPLIMNCQQTFKEDSSLMNYNQELVFSMSDVEGVGVFAFGVGKHAINPCGKSEISNLLVTPKFDNKSFDVYDLNVFSNGQIDVFLEKCYQEKNNWAFMDGQGKISELSMLSVLPLTNIVFIHFMQKDSNDETSVAELEESLKRIKNSDPKILICLIVRDCTETKEISVSEYPAWLPSKEKVNKLIYLINVQNEIRLVQKSTLIEKIMLYFNEKVREIKSLNQSKFTKDNFLDGFCKMDSQGKETHKRISEILLLSKEFFKEVQLSKEDVFNKKGLPSLKIKDEIREIKLKLRSFEFGSGEDPKSANKREEELKKQLQQRTDQLSMLEVNPVMEKFWKIVNHQDAVQIKIEVSKSLAKFTQDNVKELIVQKQNFIGKNLNKNGLVKKDGRLQNNEEIQKANDEFKHMIKEFENQIFKRSQSLEYHQRNLNCVMSHSNTYLSDFHNKEQFKKSVRQQMLDGDTFELIDGRNLEMKADIIREIVGTEIDHTKCIIVCVIGPQSTGKSTLMNFCFGTQFLASTGRCTQGIYFTLQKIPPEMKRGSEVEYLIILDTEGLNSPERAEGDRPDSEYDRKIVLFTLLCSDFLIINSSGDMSLQMKELIKICAVRYNDLRAHSKAPKILYTFVKNSDNNPEKFKEQIQSLRSDVIESSDEPNIELTADELMAVHDDSVKVLGSAYDQKLIEKDSAKGILQSTYINNCAPLFGVHASDIWQQVQNFIHSGSHQFRQIGHWLQEAEEYWSLIDRHGANITQFANVQQMKNDRKIKQYISQLWQQYMNTQITSKDNQKAMEKCQELYEKFRDGDDKALAPLKQKFIEENNEEKDDDFYNYFEEKFQCWKLEPSQRTLTVGAEIEHMKLCKNKMIRLKEGYALQIENKFKELQMTQIHSSGLSQLFRMAGALCQKIKNTSEKNQNELINDEFEKNWGKLEEEISSKSQLEQMRQTNAEYLCKTFKSVNNFMPDILPSHLREFDKFSTQQQAACFAQTSLPNKLIEFLVKYISVDGFQKTQNNKKVLNAKKQFQFDDQQIGMLKDPEIRIFGTTSDTVAEKYLQLQKFLKCDYTYSIIQDFTEALSSGSVFQQIETFLNLKKERHYYEKKWDIYGRSYQQKHTQKIDDKVEIVNKISGLFKELGLAGFILEKKEKFLYLFTYQLFQVPLEKVNVETFLNQEKIFDNDEKKKEWVKELKKEMKWDKQYQRQVTSTVQALLTNKKVRIANEQRPSIDLVHHQQQFEQLKNAKFVLPKRLIEYNFSEDEYFGKINVRKFFKEKNLEDKLNNYFQCLVRPQKYEISNACKLIYLSELANAVVDWQKIVLDIDKVVTPLIIFKPKKTEQKAQDIKKLDLQSVLERSQINIDHVEIIQNSFLQPIKNYLNDEVKQKLSLRVSHSLNGVITWIACVIILYKLQQNVIMIFNQEIEQIKLDKGKVFERFQQIAKGQTTATTKQFSEEIFKLSFEKFDGICLKDFDRSIMKHLESKKIKDQFNTQAVYQHLDETYLSQANSSQYFTQIDFVQDPVKVFTNYVTDLKEKLIVRKQLEEKQIYQDRVQKNLQTLLDRLHVIQKTTDNYLDMKDDSINFFEVLNAGKKVYDDEEKKEIETNMSPILINTFIQILYGTYTVEQQQLTITVNGKKTDYIFNVKQKDLGQKIKGSPLNDLQNLVFDDEKKPMEFFQEYFLPILQQSKNSQINGICADIRVMINELIDLIEKQIKKIKGLSLDEITLKYKAQDDIINSYRTIAIGCKEMCKFCNRKCELASHQDGDEKHNCNTRGHSLRVFGGGTLVTALGDIYPSLMTCDEIKHDTKVKIVQNGKTEVRLWSEVHNSKNTDWKTNETKYLPNKKLNPNWDKKQKMLEHFWKAHGPRYCNNMKYKYIDPKSNPSDIELKASQLSGSSIVIICLDESRSMFNVNQDFQKVVQGGKDLEKYLKANHSNPAQVQIQLWFNDCLGVNKVYQGQLSSKIPNNKWIRSGCQGDVELKYQTGMDFNYGMCGQFTGAIRILNQEINNLLANNNYESVHWYFFTDGQHIYPLEELNVLEQVLSKNRENWTFNGKHKLHPMIITNQLTIESLCLMKQKIDQIMSDNWQEENVCVLKQDVKTEKLAETIIEMFKFTS